MAIVTIIISALALFLAAFTYIAHDKRLKEQEKLINDYQLRALVQSEEDNKKAIIRAKVINIGGGKRSLLICNTGKSKATNLAVDIAAPDQIYNSRPSFPQSYNELLPEAYREILLYLSEGDNELTLSYTWDDEYQQGNKESQTIDL